MRSWPIIGTDDLFIDTSITHEFGGNNLADVSLNGQLRDSDPDRLLERTVNTKIARSRQAYAKWHCVFLPASLGFTGSSCASSTPSPTSHYRVFR